MKRYRFSLETVLRVRQAEEDSARRQLAAANLGLQRSRAALDAETDRYRSRADRLERCDLGQFRVDRSATEQMAACLAAARSVHDAALTTASARRVEWGDAARRVAALQHLDDRRRAEWQTEVRRQEDAEVNDMVTARWAAPGAGAAT